jgi:ubiquinol-cytochrome c reductase cytochrome c1 subunit
MHKHVDSQHFAYADIAEITKTGNAANGKELVAGAAACTGCHSIEKDGVPAGMDAVRAAQR